MCGVVIVCVADVNEVAMRHGHLCDGQVFSSVVSAGETKSKFCHAANLEMNFFFPFVFS